MTLSWQSAWLFLLYLKSFFSPSSSSSLTHLSMGTMSNVPEQFWQADATHSYCIYTGWLEGKWQRDYKNNGGELREGSTGKYVQIFVLNWLTGCCVLWRKLAGSLCQSLSQAGVCDGELRVIWQQGSFAQVKDDLQVCIFAAATQPSSASRLWGTHVFLNVNKTPECINELINRALYLLPGALPIEVWAKHGLPSIPCPRNTPLLTPLFKNQCGCGVAGKYLINNWLGWDEPPEHPPPHPQQRNTSSNITTISSCSRVWALRVDSRMGNLQWILNSYW